MTPGEILTVIAIVLGIGSVVTGRRLVAYLSTTAIWLALALLFVDFVTEDWSNAYVVSTTRPGLNPLLRMAGLWGGAEGSLLLFTAFIAAAASIVALHAAYWRTLVALSTGYSAVVLISANPFSRFDAPAVGGLGLQPVLEHPAMVWHPPILYLGLVGVMVPGLMVLGGASSRVVRASWGVSLALLTAGLATGAAWAHAELGWGGFWAWDPIESAGLVAWLCAVAAQHVRAPGTDRRSKALVLLPGLAAVWATTLTRAGLTGSVHSFADRPGLRTALLVVAAGWTALLIWIVSSAHGDTRPVVRQRRWAIWVLLLAALIIGLGTYEPAVESLFGGDAVGIAGTYFARLMWPLVIGGAGLAVWADRTRNAPLFGAVIGLVLVPFAAGPFGLAVGAAGGVVTGSAVGTIQRSRPGWLAHAGIGVLLVGIAGTMASTSSSVILIKDRPTAVAGQTVVHRGLELVEGPGTDTALATIEIDGETLRPSLVAHRIRNVPTAEIATSRSFLNQTQVVLSDGSDGQADYRISQTPRLNLVWVGAVIIVVGLVPRRFRRPSRNLATESVGKAVGFHTDERHSQ